MKNVFLLAPIVVALTACGSMSGTSDPYAKRAELEHKNSVAQTMVADPQRTLNQVPDWMIKLPVSTNAVYQSGTAVSADLSMADSKAVAVAYGKICMTAGGTASQSTKMYNTDSGTSSTELSEMALKTACKSVDLTGVEVKEFKRVTEGSRYRTFVLIALPTGEANVLKRAKEKAAEPQVDNVKKRAEDAFKELDDDQTKTKTESSAKVNVISDTGSSKFELLPVDNAEYRKRRDEALQKPGAVVGHLTVQ
jgi:hypothetical protein